MIQGSSWDFCQERFIDYINKTHLKVPSISLSDLSLLLFELCMQKQVAGPFSILSCISSSAWSVGSGYTLETSCSGAENLDNNGSIIWPGVSLVDCHYQHFKIYMIFDMIVTTNHDKPLMFSSATFRKPPLRCTQCSRLSIRLLH